MAKQTINNGDSGLSVRNAINANFSELYGGLLATVSTAALCRSALGLSTVAATGAYADLTGKPTLFDGAWSSLTGKPTFATVATSGAYSDLSGRPTIPTVPTVVSAFTNDSGYQTAAQVSSAFSTAALKANNLSDLASASTARTNLGLGTAATQSASAFDAAGAAAETPAVKHCVMHLVRSA